MKKKRKRQKLIQIEFRRTLYFAESFWVDEDTEVSLDADYVDLLALCDNEDADQISEEVMEVRDTGERDEDT